MGEPRVCVSIVTYNSQRYIRRCLEAGFTSHLTKPVNFSQLEQVIESAAAVKTQKNAGEARAG